MVAHCIITDISWTACCCFAVVVPTMTRRITTDVGISLIAVVGQTVARQIITDDSVPPFPRCRTHGGLPNNYVVGMLPLSGRQWHAAIFRPPAHLAREMLADLAEPTLGRWRCAAALLLQSCTVLPMNCRWPSVAGRKCTAHLVTIDDIKKATAFIPHDEYMEPIDFHGACSSVLVYKKIVKLGYFWYYSLVNTLIRPCLVDTWFILGMYLHHGEYMTPWAAIMTSPQYLRNCPLTLIFHTVIFLEMGSCPPSNDIETVTEKKHSAHAPTRCTYT